MRELKTPSLTMERNKPQCCCDGGWMGAVGDGGLIGEDGRLRFEQIGG